MRTVHVVVPAGIDDPARPSGGNVYDRRACLALGELGWSVREEEVAGDWPHPDGTAVAALCSAMGRAPDGAVVLIDGLIASAAERVLPAHARRVRPVVLMHMPLGHAGPPADRAREGAVLCAAAAVVATSDWTRRRLLELYPLDPGRVHVAPPGVDPADVAPATAAGGRLLCVAAVTRGKGHDMLIEALARVSGLSWSCRCLGSLDRDPAFVADLRDRIAVLGLDDRVTLAGPRTGAALHGAYAAADLLVLPTRGETYGMVITEALAHGVPVLATCVGGVEEAAGLGADGTRPGILVPPDDPAALGTALRTWLTDPATRRRLRRAARERRASLRGWPDTASILDGVLAGARR